MLSDDDFDRMLRGGDPVRRMAGLVDPDAPAAARIRTSAFRTWRRSRARRAVLIPAVAVVLLGATAGTRAWVAGDGEGHTLESTSVDCVQSDMSDAKVPFDIRSETPVEACQRWWQEMFDEPAPVHLVACVDSSVQGSIKVYPGGVEECARHRADPYAGPTEEQRQLARLRADLAERFAGETCVSYSDLRAAIDELFAEHELTGWVTGHFQTAERTPEGPCAEVSYYDEPNRTVWLGEHLPGDEMFWR
jgi:hypothetical protein